MRRLLKFLHTLGSAGLIGAAAALALILIFAPAANSSGDYASMWIASSKIVTWILGPSIVLTIMSGLLAMVVTPPFMDAFWVWVKAGTGILILLGGLHVTAPIQQAAKRAAEGGDAAGVLHGEVGTLWVLLGVAIANIALGVWRPRMPKYPV
ncbi:MAG: hypothetical protein NW206_11090 [Hyphomonadaceae bacterium]|nr:hypothetical protein [Hyphomonadaceae bacterium]